MSNVGTLQCRSVARTEVGLVRTRNEDSLVNRPEAGLWAIADGMGGHRAGDRASGLVREALEELDPVADVEAYLVAARSRLQTVHAQLRAAAGVGCSGSTAVVLLAADDRFACAWAGDSRLYRSRGGRLERLTRDHSLVEELVASGTLAPDSARRHLLANRITRAVGVGDGLQLDVARGVLTPSERYLLSSDGLHGVVTDAVIAELLALPDLTAAADALIAAVLRAGAPDNVTVILVAVDGASS
jgi:serine/threonine protein phosphatase PrpC